MKLGGRLPTILRIISLVISSIRSRRSYKVILNIPKPAQGREIRENCLLCLHFVGLVPCFRLIKHYSAVFGWRLFQMISKDTGKLARGTQRKWENKFTTRLWLFITFSQFCEIGEVGTSFGLLFAKCNRSLPCMLTRKIIFGFRLDLYATKKKWLSERIPNRADFQHDDHPVRRPSPNENRVFCVTVRKVKFGESFLGAWKCRSHSDGFLWGKELSMHGRIPKNEQVKERTIANPRVQEIGTENGSSPEQT